MKQWIYLLLFCWNKSGRFRRNRPEKNTNDEKKLGKG